MSLARLLVPLARLDEVAGYVNDHDVVVGCTDADTVIAVASLRDRLTRPIGLWLVLSDDYAAQLAARDVATLSWLVTLGPVVIERGRDAAAHADVVRALLTNDEVNVVNDAATIRGAYNRPAPPRPVTVWSWDGEALRTDGRQWHVVSSASDELGEFTTYA